MKLLPDQLLGGIGMPQLDDEQSKMMEKELKRTEAIIDSMTWEERNDHRILNANRRRRIARGSGTTVAERQSAHQAVRRDASDDAPAFEFRTVWRWRTEKQDVEKDDRHAGHGRFCRRRRRDAVVTGWAIKEEVEEETKEETKVDHESSVALKEERIVSD